MLFVLFEVLTVFAFPMMWKGALSYPYKVPCSDAIVVGQTWMGVDSIQDNTHSIQVFRDASQLSAGASYAPGETLTVTFRKPPGSQFMLATDYATFPGSVCGGTRAINPRGGSMQVTMPASGSVSFWAASAGGYGQNVGIIASFTLTPSGAALPSVAPTALPSVQPSSKPTLQPSAAPSSNPSAVPSKLPSASPSSGPSITLSTSPNLQRSHPLLLPR